MSDMGVQPVPVAAPGMSQMQRVVCAFTAPSKTFEDIKRGNRSWWMPWVIMALVGYIFFAAVYMKIGMQTVVDNQIHMDPKAEERLAQAPPEARATSQKVSLYITEGVFAAGPIFVLVVAAVVAVVLWGTINFVFGGKATFGSVFAVWFFANLPQLFKSLLGTIVIFAGAAPETFNIKNYAPTNFGAFMNPVEANKALYALASAMDVITIWTLILMGMGIAIVAGVKRSSGYIAVFGWWAIIVLIGVGFAAVTG
jgi:hypothetical protein